MLGQPQRHSVRYLAAAQLLASCNVHLSTVDNTRPRLAKLHMSRYKLYLIDWLIDWKQRLHIHYDWLRYTSLTNFIIQQSLCFEGIRVPLRLTNCLFPVPASQPTAPEHFQSLLYGSGTVFRSISHLLRHFPSSALTWRHTTSNSVTRNYCCRAREVTLSFTDTLIALSHILTIAVLTRMPTSYYRTAITLTHNNYFCGVKVGTRYQRLRKVEQQCDTLFAVVRRSFSLWFSCAPTFREIDIRCSSFPAERTWPFVAVFRWSRLFLLVADASSPSTTRHRHQPTINGVLLVIRYDTIR